jgi:hypothetical protein
MGLMDAHAKGMAVSTIGKMFSIDPQGRMKDRLKK